MKKANLIKRGTVSAPVKPAQTTQTGNTWSPRDAIRAKQSAAPNAERNARAQFRNLFAQKSEKSS